MELLQIILLISVFLLMALMMFFRKIPALVALPLMAVLIAFIGGIKFNDIIEYVVGQGSLKLNQAYTIALFGSMLSVLMQKTGVAETFIKKGAELSGDNPWLISIILLLLIISLFTTLGGLGAIIMVATIVLPIMSSVGIGPMTSVGIFLFGLSIGGILNVGNWAVYISVMGLTIDEIRPFAMMMFLVSFLGAIVYITIQIYRDGHDLDFKKIILRSSILIISLAILYYLFTSFTTYEFKVQFNNLLSAIGISIKWIIAVGIVLLFLTALLRIVLRKN
jgi:H+/gluconate symporter-like permease